MAPSGEKLPFHTGFPSNSTGWRSAGPLCFMEHKPLRIRALSREGCKFWKHWEAYVCTMYTHKNKNFIDNQWNSWFGLISILVCKPACLYWHALWSQQYNFWPTLAPRITLNYSMILSKRHHNTHKEPGPSCWLTHALTLLLGFAKNARAKLVSGKV